MNTSNEPDDAPDFSFLGNDAVPDSVDEFDFSVAENTEQPSEELPGDLSADVSDVPEFPDVVAEVSEEDSAGFDFSTESEPSVTTTVPDELPEPAAAAPAKKSVRRLTPKKRQPAPEPAAPAPPELQEEAGPSESKTDLSPADQETTAAAEASSDEAEEMLPGDVVSKKTFSLVAGYAAALTLLFLILLFTGRLNLAGPHPLESLPDIAPLKSNEFQEVRVPAGAKGLPDGHALTIGQSQRYGDVIFTPIRVTREPVTFASMLTGAVQENMATPPVLKLWFKFENVSDRMAFPPWDVSLMSNRSPAEGTDDSTLANSWLMVTEDGAEKRILNYLHSPNSNFDIVGQNSRKMISPGEELTAFVACSDGIAHISSAETYRWRVQIRKGVNSSSGNGVTTLIDVTFSQDDIGA